MDVYEEEFRDVVVAEAEGWSAQTEETSLNSRVDGDDGDEADFVDKGIPVVEKQTQTQTQAGRSRAKRRREEKDLIVEACVKRAEILDKKNRMALQLLERERAFSVENVLETLNGLHGVRMWSPFYEAAIEHLLADEVNRQGFIAFPKAEDKIKFLELRTRRNLND